VLWTAKSTKKGIAQNRNTKLSMKKLLLQNSKYLYLIESFGEWLDILGYSEQTIYQLPIHVKEFLYWLEQKNIQSIGQINPEQIQDYYYQLRERKNHRRGGGLSLAYLNKHQQAISKFFDYLRQSGRLDFPSINLKNEVKTESLPNILSQAEVKQLYNSTYLEMNEEQAEIWKRKPAYLWEVLQQRDRAMLSVFYGCGLRRNEAWHLNVKDIDLDKNRLHVRKGKGYKERFVPIHESNKKHFEIYLYNSRLNLLKSNKNEAFLISERSNRMSKNALQKRLQTIVERAELYKNISLHSLRHSIATHLLQNGMPLNKIQQFLGHSSLESTQIYTHLSADRHDLIPNENDK